ncbi:hypothetical protein Afil01_53350 [Actinorhabdospora filicis]|uniref:DUF4440 domain-containing protein n=1 Tax=Actinorhabdospora filicis TaxID=1785913 RepID=A0A9W6WBX9_9ACTN|nr:nuclear transport factor 2 family protein [Actinorhabdospora filicis]GLZ80528.1 hypothetical protein Afil01_53350 [Actinorhabdospora filicis]
MSTDPKAEAELIALEEAMWDANRAGDGAYYDKVLRDDAMGVSKWGLLDKATAVAGISANHNPYLKTDLSQIKVLMVNEDAAVVTYKADVLVLVNGEETPTSAYASTVYARENGTWTPVFFQHTPL